MINRNYFSNASVSNSALSTINPDQGGSPKDYLDFFRSDREFKTSLSLERGNLVHLYCENPNEFVTLDIPKPTDKLGVIADIVVNYIIEARNISGMELPDSEIDNLIVNACKSTGWNYSAARKWSDESLKKNACPATKPYILEASKIENYGKITMSRDTKDIVDACIKSLHNHPLSQQLLFEKPGFGNEVHYNELEIYWKEYVTIMVNGRLVVVEIPCKAKIDRLIIDYDACIIKLPDIKTSSKPKAKFQESFEYYHYYRQHAFYRLAVRRWLEKTKPELDLSLFHVDSYNVVVETINNFQVGVVPVSNFWLNLGRQEVRNLLGRVAWHIETKKWDMSLEEYESGGYLVLKDEKLYK